MTLRAALLLAPIVVLSGCVSLASLPAPSCLERAAWTTTLPEAAAIPDLVGRRGDIVDGRLYLSGGAVYTREALTHAYIVALDPATGRLLWTWRSADGVAPYGLTPTHFVNGVVVAVLETPIPASDHAGAVGIDAQTGQELWTRPAPAGYEEYYDSYDGILFVQGRSGQDVRLDERTGREMPDALVPARNTSRLAPSVPPAPEDPRAFFSGWDGDVVAMDMTTKEELWRVHVGLSKTWTKNMGGWVLGPEHKPVGVQVREQGVLVQKANASWLGSEPYTHLRLLDKDTGDTKWRSGRMYGSAIRDTGSIIIFDVDPPVGVRHLLGIEAETGDAAWRCKMDDSLHTLFEQSGFGVERDRPLYLVGDDRIAKLEPGP